MNSAAAADLLRRPDVAALFAALDGRGEALRIVGGAVRNALIGAPDGDIDCATTMEPQETTRRAQAAGFRVVPTGIEHGTVTVLVDGRPFEVTTLRQDVETDGRRAVVRFGRDFERDAERRDFTINALSLDAQGVVHDPVGGLADLAERRVRFIGDAGKRVEEDYLRILRFFRFHAQYGHGAPDPAGLHACIVHRNGLDRLSRERIRAEMEKLLSAPAAVAVLADMTAAGILQRILAGLAEPGRLDRLARADHAPADWVWRLAALAVLAPGDDLRLRDRLRLSNAEADAAAAFGAVAAALKSPATALSPADLLRLGYRHGRDAVVAALLALRGEPRPVLAADGAALAADLAAGRRAIPGRPFAGRDMAQRGVPPGPAMGRAVAAAEAAWLAAGLPDDPDVLARLLDAAAAGVRDGA